MTYEIEKRKRIVTKIGNVFCVEFGDGTKGYFQYIANDMEQLNSSVIRVFKTHYPVELSLKIDDIVTDEIDFYAHTVLRPAIADGLCYKFGKSTNIGQAGLNTAYFACDIETEFDAIRIFRFVNPLKKWYIWKVNNPKKFTGSLKGINCENLEYGGVIPFEWIRVRMIRGYYIFTNKIFKYKKRIPREQYKTYIKILNKNQIKYLCFKGDCFEKEIIATENRITRITRDEAVINHMDIAKTKFPELYLEYKNFITEDEFNEIWNSVD